MPQLTHTPPAGSRTLRLFGTVRVAGPGAHVGRAYRPVPGDRPRALLAYLGLRPGDPVPREQVREALWPEAAADESRRLLSDTLYRLRQALDPAWLEAGDDHLQLVDDGDLWVDVAAFQQLSRSDDEADLQAAVELHADELLRDVYDEWSIAPRELLREAFLASLASLGVHATERGDLDRAIDAWQQLTWAEPLREDAYVALMRLLADAGRPLEALAVYGRLRRVVREELDIGPPPEARRHARALEQQLATRTAGMARRPSQGSPPMVGRFTEQTRLLGLMDRAAGGQPAHVAVVGPEGIGKTALLGSLARGARERGWTVAHADAEAGTGPLKAALAKALSSPDMAQLAPHIQPAWRSVAARGLPGIDGGAGDSMHMPPLGTETLARAIARLLGALADVRPVLISVDDAQVLSDDEWALADALHGALAGARVLIAFSARVDEPRLRARAARWHAAGELLRLEPLAEDELRALAVACGYRSLADDVHRRLRSLSGGNPLVAVACLEAGLGTWGAESPASHREPEAEAEVDQRPTHMLRDIVLRQLRGLSAPARQAIDAAAVVGREVVERRWRAATGGEVHAAVRRELQAAGLLRVDHGVWRWPHDALRREVEAAIGRKRRRELHARVLGDLEHDPSATAHVRLLHARAAGKVDGIADHALEAGHEALDRLRFEHAASALTEALDTLPRDRLAARLRAAQGLIKAHRRLGQRDAEAAAIATFGELAEASEEPGTRAEAMAFASTHASLLGQLEQAQALAEQGLPYARQAGDTRLEARLRGALAYVARDRGDLAAAERHLRAAHEAYGIAEDDFGIGTTLDKLANLSLMAGDAAAAEHGHQEAARRLAAAGAVVEAATARSGLALALRKQGRLAEGRRIHQEVLALMRDLHLPMFVVYQLLNLGNLALQVGDPLGAVEHYEEALSTSRELHDPRSKAMSLNNLGAAYLELGDPARGLERYEEALALNVEHGYRRGAAYAQFGRGKALMALEQLDEARGALERAAATWAEIGERAMALDTEAARVELALRAEEVPPAADRAQELLDQLKSSDPTAVRQAVHLAAGRAFAASGARDAARDQLGHAESLMRAAGDGLSEDQRQRALVRVDLHRRTAAAVQALAVTAEVQLVRDDVPLGRALGDTDYVTVRWTTLSPGDAHAGSSAERRRRALQRMAREAAAQGARATDADLAEALGVSRRTILRDVKLLATRGVTVPTRRRHAARG